MTPPISTTAVGRARLVVWDRQARRNAWTRETIEAIADALEAAGADEAVRCIVVSGAGAHFSAGDDLFAALASDRSAWAATWPPFSA